MTQFASLMPPNSRVELYLAIRRDARAGVSGREIQRKHGVGWRTVQAALASVWPPVRAAYPARPSKLDAFKPVIDELANYCLHALDAAGRLTSKTALRRLVNFTLAGLQP
jgi:transposase